MTPIQKLAKLALGNPELRADLLPLLKQYAVGGGPEQVQASAYTQVTGPPTTEIYENKIDHGYDQALGGGTDVMKRLQDQFLIEQGREPREPNPRLAFCQAVQSELASMLTRDSQGKVARDRVRNCVSRYMRESGETVLVGSVVEDIINEAVGVALDPQRVGRIIARHTTKEQS